MIINKASIASIFKNLNFLFNKTFKETKTNWQRIAMEVKSEGSEENYKWLGRFPKLREWIGEKAVKALAAFKYTLTNKKYEATIEVDRDDIKDGKLHEYGLQASMIGRESKRFPQDLVVQALEAGFTEKCYDDQYFFDTDHPVGADNPTSVSNKGVAVLSNTNLAAADASYGAARTAMMELTDDEGRPLEIGPDLLVVPPALEVVAKALMNNNKLADGTENPYKGTAEVLVIKGLKSKTQWYLLNTDNILKPIIFQNREEPEFVSAVDEQSENVFLRGKYLYGVEARGAAGYGFWQQAYGSTGTG